MHLLNKENEHHLFMKSGNTFLTESPFALALLDLVTWNLTEKCKKCVPS
jgi:hypothetical protein